MVQKNNWVQIPYEIRKKLVEIFIIPRSETVVVDGMIVKSDGRSQRDLDGSITIDKMRDYLGLQSTDVSVTGDDLFKKVLNKVQGIEISIGEPEKPQDTIKLEEVDEVKDEVKDEVSEIITEPIIKKKGRPKKI